MPDFLIASIIISVGGIVGWSGWMIFRAFTDKDHWGPL